MAFPHPPGFRPIYQGFHVAYSTKVLYKVFLPEALVARLLPWGTVQRDHRSLPEALETIWLAESSSNRPHHSQRQGDNRTPIEQSHQEFFLAHVGMLPPGLAHRGDLASNYRA